MKIISKYKDYYDYLQGIYGIDDKLILDRRAFQQPLLLNHSIIRLVIGDVYIEGYYYENKCYWGQKQLDNLMIMTGGSLPSWREDDYTHGIFNKNTNKTSFLNCNIININNNTNCAIFLCKKGEILEENIEFRYPKLSDININSILPAHDVWLLLTDYLSKKVTESEPEVPVGDDKIRIVAAGFDLKTSFRNNK
jgi:hypothetical protein